MNLDGSEDFATDGAGRQLLRESIYGRLRQEILSCQLQPAAELREQELARRFAVSKSPVREALHRLEREKLVIVTPRQGYRVAPISMADARDVMELRRLLEAAGVMEAARRASAEELGALDRFCSFDPAGYEGGFIQYNRDFHAALLSCCGNSRLIAIGRSLLEEIDRVVQASLEEVGGRDPTRLVEEHAAIIAAVKARKAGGAARLLRRHLDAATKRILAALSRRAVVA